MAERQVRCPDIIVLPLPEPEPVREPWWWPCTPLPTPQIQQWPPCMFDNLPPGVYGIACPCPRHTIWCG